MRFRSWVPGSIAVTVAAVLSSPVVTGRAHAFGRLWSSTSPPVQQTALTVLFVDDPGPMVTVVVQPRYAGRAEDLAWVIPVQSVPVVELSSSVVLERLAAATAPEYWLEVGLDGECADAGVAPAAPDAGSDTAAPGPPGSTHAALELIDRGSAGDYAHATFRVDPAAADPVGAATQWLAANGYPASSSHVESLAPYLRDGYALFALALRGDAETGAIRPVKLTYESELPAIPLRPTAAAAADGMRIHVFVLGPSQAVPIDDPSLVLNDALIDWLSSPTFVAGTLPVGGIGPVGPVVILPRNYDALVARAVEEAGGRGFVTELAAPASQFRDEVWSSLDDENLALVKGQSYAEGIDAVVMAHAYYAGWDGFRGALAAAATLPEGVTLDQLARDPERHRQGVSVDAEAFLRALEAEVVAPVADAAALLQRAPYLTRVYSRMRAADMTTDPVFDYNADLAQVSNVRVARQRIACESDLAPGDAPFRIELPQGGVVVGEGGDGWPFAAGSLPASLKIVRLGTSGSGRLLTDNSAAIGAALFERSGAWADDAALRPPQHGLAIGGTQSVIPFRSLEPLPARRRLGRRGSCGAAPLDVPASCALPAWWPLVAGLLARRLLARRE